MARKTIEVGALALSCLLGILVSRGCAGQTSSAGPSNPEALSAALTADLRGADDAEPVRPGHVAPVLGPLFTETDLSKSPQARPSAGAVSITQLRHKPPKSARKAVTRGIRFAQLGDHARAAEEFESAIKEDAEFAIAYDGLGVEYARMGRYGEAEIQLRRSMALDPGSWAHYYNLGLVLYQMGDFQGADRSVRQALTLSPANSQAKELFAMLQITRLQEQ